MLIVNIFSRFDGNPGTYYTFVNYWGNVTIFLINPLLPSMWLKYVHYQIFQEQSKTRKLNYPLIAINLVNAFIFLITRKSGGYFYIDSLNIYHRGPLFLLAGAITVSLLIFSIVLNTEDINDLEKIVSRMKAIFQEYNRSNKKPYNLEFSCGYAVYDHKSKMDVEEFKKHIDKMMYENKSEVREERRAIKDSI